MPADSPHLSIVIPVYNEASIVASAVEELTRELDARKWDWELILAENGSRDATPQILEGLAAANPRVRWFHSERPNYGAALKRGIEEARGELVICDEIDLCDVSFYDAALPRLERGEADLVVGSKIALGFRGTDTHGLKAFRRDRLGPVLEQCVVDMDVFASELVIRAWRRGLNVEEIPIQLHEKRQPSIHLFRRVPNVLKNVAKLVYVIRVRGK
jgi:glycosyltransferase involved in cell wall biosynthesis